MQVKTNDSDSRSKILEAASELFLEKGVAGLSVRAISKRAGLSTIGIYSHFSGKQGILDALYIEGFHKVLNAMSIDNSEGTTLAQLLESCEAYLAMAKQSEAHYRLIFGEGDAGYQPSPDARLAAELAFSKLVSVAETYIQGVGLSIKPLQGALDVWAIVHGYVSISHHAVANDSLDWGAMAMDAVERQIQSWR